MAHGIRGFTWRAFIPGNDYEYDTSDDETVSHWHDKENHHFGNNRTRHDDSPRRGNGPGLRPFSVRTRKYVYPVRDTERKILQYGYWETDRPRPPARPEQQASAPVPLQPAQQDGLPLQPAQQPLESTISNIVQQQIQEQWMHFFGAYSLSHILSLEQPL